MQEAPQTDSQRENMGRATLFPIAKVQMHDETESGAAVTTVN